MAMPWASTRGRAWLVLCVVAGAAFAVVWWAFPRSNQASLGEFAAKLGAFVVVALVVALFPLPGRRVWWLQIAAFLVFAGFLIPRISGYYYLDTTRADGDAFYTHLYLLTYPAIVLTASASYRLGGGSSGTTLKVALSGVLILFSGFLDFMWQLVNPVSHIPAELAPPHIVAITGGPLSFAGVIWFAAAHVPILVLIVLLPLDRWLDRLLGPDPALALTDDVTPRHAAPVPPRAEP